MDTNHPVDGARETGGYRPGDFFTRLAERTLGIALLAQPVIAPAFAPEPGVSTATGDGFFEWAEASQVSAEPAPSGAAAIPSPAGESLRPVSGADSSVLVPAARIQPEGMSARPERTGRLTASRPDSPETPASPATFPLQTTASSQVPSLGDGPLEDRGHTLSVRSSSVEQAAFAQTREPARLLVPKMRLAEQPEERGEPIDERQARLLVPDRTRNPGLAIPFEAANNSARRESLQPAQADLTNLEASHQPPTIRITIGRVEVRAVQAPPTAPARPAPRPAPALSLADYLKGRNEARR